MPFMRRLRWELYPPFPHIHVRQPGKLGYSTELLQSWEIFNNMVIRPERKLILDAFKEVLVYNGVARVSIEELTPIKIEETPPQQNNN